jgi:Domain of unknown function (DUF5134)
VSTPAWILETFAAVMLLVAEVAVGRLVAARAWTRHGGADADIAVALLLTGIALAGILVPSLSIRPHVVWEVVFAAMTAWFAWRLWRESRGRGVAAGARGDRAPLLVNSAAMLYLVAALGAPSAGGSGMSGMGWTSGTAGGSSPGVPTLHASALALIFALLVVAFTVRDLDRRALTAAAEGPASGYGLAYAVEGLLLSPAVAKGCRVATSVAVAFLLIIAI